MKPTILQVILNRYNAIVDSYHNFVESHIRCPRTRGVFHTFHGSVHACYFAGVASHNFEVYGTVAGILAVMTVFSLIIMRAE